uniref:Uncharacterized protein n=1 Tax=Rhizophora mucronata TaxID=61149 RepID=A0A2P2R4Y5_RHIMU
MLYYVSIAHSH